MWAIILISAVILVFLILTWWGYHELVQRAQTRFFAWNNVLGQQHLLLDQVAILIETTSIHLPRTALNDVIHVIRLLLDTPEDNIIMIGRRQTQLIMLLRTLIDAAHPMLQTENPEWWITCQDTFISKIDDLLLAQRHYNTAANRYNAWRHQLFVYWVADYLGYRFQYPLAIDDHSTPSQSTDN